MFRLTIMLIVFSFVSSVLSQDHGNRSHYAQYSPDGKYIAIAGDDLLLLDRSNSEVRVVNEYNPEARNAFFSSDGRYLAAEAMDFTIYVYDLENPQKQPVFFKGLVKEVSSPSNLKFSPDGEFLITGNASKINIYSLKENGKVVHTINNDPANPARYLAPFDISSDWKTIVFNMQVVHLKKSADGFKHDYGKKLEWDGGSVTSLIVAADGSKAAIVAKSGKEQRVFDLKTASAILANTSPPTVALTANKDFSKIYMNQAIWDLKTRKLQILYQTRSIDKNDKPKVTVAPDGEFMVGLYQYTKNGRFKASLQVDLTVFNRVAFDGDEVLYYRDLPNGRYDVHAANFKEGYKGRSNRNLANDFKISGALATSPDGSYGINHLSRIIRKKPMSVSAPLFSLSYSKGLAAAISPGGLIAIVNRRSIYLTLLAKGTKDLNARKKIKPINPEDELTSNSDVKIKISNNSQFIAVSYLKPQDNKGNPDIYDTVIKIFDVQGNVLASEEAFDVNAITFSNDSRRFYFNSGKKLTCLSVEVNTDGISWVEDDVHTFYTESGSILGLALSEDDSLIGYAASNGYNKVVKARYGNDVATSIMQESNRLKVKKK